MKLKKVMAMAMTAALGLSLVGCGGGDTTESGDTTEKKAESSTGGEEASGDLTYGSIRLGED